MGQYCIGNISFPPNHCHNSDTNEIALQLKGEYVQLMSRLLHVAESVLAGVKSVAYTDSYNFAVEVINDLTQRLKDPSCFLDIEKDNSDALCRICQEQRPSLWERTLGTFNDMVEYSLYSIEFVLGIAKMNRIVNFNFPTLSVDNDFWSKGEFGQLEKELCDYKKELESIQSASRIVEIERRSREIEGRFLQITAESVAKEILSEERVETVEDIINAMMKTGWILKGIKKGNPENSFMGGKVDRDWREGVFAIMENNMGEEVTIIVAPVSNTHNRIIVYQHSDTPHLLSERIMVSLDRELDEEGYYIDEMLYGDRNIPEMESAEFLGKAHAVDFFMKYQITI